MKTHYLIGCLMALAGCSAGSAGSTADSTDADVAETQVRPNFDADSAYSYVESLMAFGPRVPNTEAHRRSGDWLIAKLKSFGWEVSEQKDRVTAFDGTPLEMRNIFARLNPGASERILLLAHWDCRPWADQDPDPSRRSSPVPGANDGASGVGVLLEIARQMRLDDSKAGVDILLVDAEDWGTDDNDDSWALGTQYFANNPPVGDYRPRGAILLDMVGSPDARFGYEYFSQQANSPLLEALWNNAASLGHGDLFKKEYGGAVNDDHVPLIKAGIPAIDIIDYRYSPSYQGFDPVWHTTADDMKNISRKTLGAVGETVMSVIN